MERFFEHYNIVGGKHLISNEAWTVSIVRSKAGRGAEHGFLLIEGLYKGEYKGIRADLFVKKGAAMGSSAISGESGLKASNYAGNASAKVIPASAGECVIYASNVSGKSDVRMKELMLEEMKELEGQCEYKTYGITVKQAEQLLASIAKDVGADIGYSLCGDGASYSCSFLSNRYHSCVSWAMEKLAGIDIKVEGTWHDFAIKITSKILPGAKADTHEEDERRETGCRMM